MNEQLGRLADERCRTADEDHSTSCGGPNGLQRVGVEAPGEPPPRGGWSRLPPELAAIDDLGGRARADEQARVDRARLVRAWRSIAINGTRPEPSATSRSSPPSSMRQVNGPPMGPPAQTRLRREAPPVR